MKINILASALVVTLLLGPTSLLQGQTQRSSESNSDANSAAAKARKDAVNKVRADLRTAISNDPKNAAKYTAAAVQILGIDTKTEAGRAELNRIQATARNALRNTDSFQAMPRSEKLAAIESVTTESTNAVGTPPTITSITVNPLPTNPLNFPNTLEITNPLIVASIAGILGNNTEPAGTRATTFFAGLGFPSGTNFTSNTAGDGTVSIVVNPPPVSNPSPPPTL
jgi:hypothetical protein